MVETQYFGLYGLFCKMLLIHRFIKPEKQEAAVFNNRAFYHTGFMLL
jgi:hypothetical protein